MDGEIYYTTAIPESSYKQQYLDMCFEGDISRYLSYYIPLVAYHENKTELTADNFTDTSNTVDFLDTKGFYPRDGEFVADVKDWTQMEKWVIGERSLAMLDDIVNTCHKQVMALNSDLIAVKLRMQYVEKYKKQLDDAIAAL